MLEGNSSWKSSGLVELGLGFEHPLYSSSLGQVLLRLAASVAWSWDTDDMYKTYNAKDYYYIFGSLFIIHMLYIDLSLCYLHEVIV